ncbi:MAG: flagellar motor protein MotB [Pseudomonadota bacterium]
MSAAEPTIIIKRPKKIMGGGHHGGAWKVAYADFVTAMMAFFLLMWLLNATTEDQRRGLADYFNPSIPIAAVSGGGADALNGSDVDDKISLTVLSETKTTSDREAGRPGDVTSDSAMPDETPTDTEVAEALESVLDGEAAELSEHISIRMSPEGLVIELTDRESQPLFASGSADPSPVLNRLCAAVAAALYAVENKVKIVGHTDSRRFVTDRAYSNWELSSDRANVARRLIQGAGLGEYRIEEVSGRAATMPLVEDPLDPRNRRISITLLRH